MSDQGQQGIERDDIVQMDIDRDGDIEPISERDPVELAQGYLDEVSPGSGWLVDEVSGNSDFAMVTVLLGRYEGDSRVETVEGHGTGIPEAVDAALGPVPDAKVTGDDAGR
jgi:hypothetical protein